jgi:hypothetical protein
MNCFKRRNTPLCRLLLDQIRSGLVDGDRVFQNTKALIDSIKKLPSWNENDYDLLIRTRRAKLD